VFAGDFTKMPLDKGFDCDESRYTTSYYALEVADGVSEWRLSRCDGMWVGFHLRDMCPCTNVFDDPFSDEALGYVSFDDADIRNKWGSTLTDDANHSL
jgi:hypothetical protein